MTANTRVIGKEIFCFFVQIMETKLQSTNWKQVLLHTCDLDEVLMK